MPYACIGVDVIVGFPGETVELFLETYNFLNELDISYLHVFTYSERDNTLAVTMENVVPKLRNLMAALNVASKHLEAVGKANVMINVYGDFGRNVHLNGSMGWDHGNNQNLLTVSANPNAPTITSGGIEGYQLGKIIGRTENYYEGSVRQYTRPVEGSYEAQPFAVASTIYNYFGVQNPEIMTDNIAPIDFVNPPNEWVAPS